MINFSNQPPEGFTLLELLAGISLTAIVLCISLPFAPALYKKNKLHVLTDDVKAAIQYAKIQAVMTGEQLALTRLPGAGDWSDGMLLFVDNANHQYTTGAKLLHEWRWQSSEIQVSWHGFQSQDYLLFSPEMSSSAVNGSFTLTNAMHQQTKLVVNRLGRVSQHI